MKKFTLLLIVLLTACGATPYSEDVSVYSNSDPNVSAEIARQTKVAYQAQAEAQQAQEDLFEAQAAGTSTAFAVTQFAPVAAVTRAAADMAIQNMYAQATSTSAAQTQVAGVTATAQSWTPTPNATSTIVAAQVSAMQTQITNQSKRQDISNNFWAVIVPIFLLAILLVIVFIGISWSRKHRHTVHQSSVPGDKPIIVNNVTGEIVDADANPNYSTGKETSLTEQMFVQWLERRYGFKPQHPQITAERQDLVKARDQMIDFHARVARLPRPLVSSQGTKFLTPPEQVSAGMDAFPLPAWDQLVTYPFKAGGDFPFGAFAQELARIDVNKYPHLGVVGPTGCGKSRLFLRPFIASALASGNRVIVLGDMVDFVVFQVHPNATLVPVYQITKPADAAQYVNALMVINSEMERRFQQLADQNLSTWERAGGENTVIVLDELGPNLDILDDTNPQAARSLRGFLSILISKGRKAGFNFVFASTRAVGLKKQLSQVSTIAFRLKDTDEERYAFGQSGYGAERLPESYFLSKIGSTVRMTGSFNPSDGELGDFLLRHRTKALDKPTWIEGVFAAPTPLSRITATAPQIEGRNLERDDDDAGRLPGVKMNIDEARAKAEEMIREEDETVRILELHAQRLSNTNIVYKIWGKASSLFDTRMAQVKAVVATATATATAPEAPKMTDFRPVTA